MANQTLRLVGLGFVLACSVALWGFDTPVYADILAPGGLAMMIAQETTVEFSPTPSPSPTPTPNAASLIARGGRITYLVSGSLSFGSTFRNTANNGSPLSPIGPTTSPSPSSSPIFPFQPSNSTSQDSSSAGAGAQIQVSRRTASTYTNLTLPLGVSSQGGYTTGQATAIYSTPKYSVAYEAQGLSQFGQLALGSTLRGISFIVPNALGEDILFEGPTVGEEGEVLRLIGLLSQIQTTYGFFEAGYVQGDGPLTGNAKTLIFGGASAGTGAFSVVGEGAWQERTGGDGDPHGLAFQLRLSDILQSTGAEATVRSIPDQFVAFGYGGVNSDRYLDTNFHAGSSADTVYVDANWERTGDDLVGIAEQRVLTLATSMQTKIGGLAISVVQQNGTQVSPSASPLSQDTTAGQIQLSTQYHEFIATFGAQLQRSISAGIPSSTRSFGFDLSRQFGTLGFGLQGLQQRQTQAGLAPTLQNGANVTVYRQFGKKTQINFSEGFTHTISPTSDATELTPLLTVTRELSPVISIGVSGGFTRLHDVLNPASDGTTKLFSFQINAPFNYGNATTGRADPRLPASISGRVQLAPRTANAGAFAGFSSFSGGASGGLSNVIVTLDDRYVQRTDLTGGFEFSFLPAGQHELKVETSSIPRGMTVQTPVVTLTLQGGQTAQVLFSVGNYAGILGHVWGLDATGKKIPLQNVQLQIDGKAFSQTDTTGAYGFGGLTAGKHEVDVIQSSIPAFATFDPSSLKQTVTAYDGQYTTLDFSAEALGSIAGRIIYGADVAGEGFTGGPLNAYVVAEPGEHAAIDDTDGSFVIDNLLPGDYTISVDPETLTNGFGAQPDSITVHLGPGEHYDEAAFTVGRSEKKVVFTLMSGTSSASAPVVHLSERRLPPSGSTLVTVDAPESAKSVELFVFDQHLVLAYDATAKVWAGKIEVPATAKGGDYTVTASAASGTIPESATLTVDPKMPLAILQTAPKNPGIGVVANVRARFLVDVKAGDTIQWEDGQTTVLGKPVTGRVFTFTVRISLRPLHGVLLTGQGRLPIVLL